MLPNITDEINVDNIIQNEQAALTIGKSFLFDFDKGDFILKDGKLVKIDELESLKVWVEKTLRTEKFRFKIYKKDTNREFEYGITLQDLIVGNNYPIEFIESEIKREVTEALLKHPMIESLGEWDISKSNPILNISFKIALKDGTNIEQEVPFN